MHGLPSPEHDCSHQEYLVCKLCTLPRPLHKNKHSMNSSDINEPSIWAEPGYSGTYGSGSVLALTGTAVTVTQSYSASSSRMIWLVLLWLVLLLLVVGLVYVLVDCRCRNQNQMHHQQQDVPETHDVTVAVAEAVVAIEPKRRKTDNLIGLTILFVGSFIGLGLSIFSISTCEFASRHA